MADLSGKAAADSQLAAGGGSLLVDCRQVVCGGVAKLVVSHAACLHTEEEVHLLSCVQYKPVSKPSTSSLFAMTRPT